MHSQHSPSFNISPTKQLEYTLPSAFLRSSPTLSTKLYPVSDNELAFLVLRYLKENKFRKSYEAFVTESAGLTTSLHTYYQNATSLHHTKPKTLWAILSEYLAFHDEKQSRMRILQIENNTVHQNQINNSNKSINNPLGLKMKETFEKLSEMVADYHTLRESFIETNQDENNTSTRTTKQRLLRNSGPASYLSTDRNFRDKPIDTQHVENNNNLLFSSQDTLDNNNSNQEIGKLDSSIQSQEAFPKPTQNISIPNYHAKSNSLFVFCL